MPTYCGTSVDTRMAPGVDPSAVTVTRVQVTASVLRLPFQRQHFAPEPTLFSVAHGMSGA